MISLFISNKLIFYIFLKIIFNIHYYYNIKCYFTDIFCEYYLVIIILLNNNLFKYQKSLTL